MSQLRNRIARIVNDGLRRVNLAVVRRDRHDAMARDLLLHVRQSLGRDARPLHESVRTLGSTATGTLAERAAASFGGLGQRVLAVGNSFEATLLADAIEATGRLVERTNLRGLPSALERSPADIVLMEPARGAEQYELVHRLRFEQGRRVFTQDELMGGAALLEAINQLVGVYVQPLSKAVGYMAGSPIWDPIESMAARESLVGKRVLEFGPLDGCMTGSIVEAGADSVTCIEVRLANVLKVLVARQIMGWSNVDLVIDDMHNVDGKAYGTFDVVVAHGVYYHSSTPFRFLRNLATLGDTIFLGGYCSDAEQPRAPLVTLEEGDTSVRAQPFREKLANDGAGVHVAGYYFVAADLIRIFEQWGFAVEVVSLEPTPPERQASHYIRMIARRR